MSSNLGVVIPAFNAEKTIDRAVRSALQSGAEHVLVVDDESTDATGAVAALAGADVVRQANSGAARARINGIQILDTDLVVFLDADDTLIPSGVTHSIAVLDRDSSLGVAAGTVIGVGPNGDERPFPVRYTPVTTTTLLVNGFGPWPPCAAVVRKAHYLESLEITPAALSPRFAEDYETLIRMSMVAGVDVREEPTCRYSLTGGKSVRSAELAIQAKESIRSHYAGFLGIDISPMSPLDRRRAALTRRARSEWAEGRKLQAASTIAAWVALDPTRSVGKLRTKPWTRN